MSEIINVSAVNATAAEIKEDTDMLSGDNATAVNGLPVGIRDISLGAYLDDVKGKHLSTDVAIQRGDDQWKMFQKERLIESVLRKRPMPPIFTAWFNDTEVIYDGLQRTTTLKDYQDNKFAVNKKYYKDLSDEERKTFNEYELHIDNAGTVNGDELAELFINLNNGTALVKAQKLKGFVGYDNAALLNTMCQSDLMTRLAAFTDLQKKSDAALECLIQGMIITDVFLDEDGEETFEWKNISRDEQVRYSNEVLSHKSPEELKKYQDAIEYASKISGRPEYKKTMVPAIIFLSRVAIMSGMTVEEFDEYVGALEHNKPEAYKKNMGSGNVSKKATVGRIEALFKDFKKRYPEKVTMEIDFEAKFKRTTNAKKTVKSKAESVTAVEATTASTEVKSSTATNSEAVATEVTADVEVSNNTEATESTSEVENSDISNANGVSKSAEAPADVSSDTSDTTVEGSASDSSEADAEYPSDGSDGTEEVA